MKTKHICIALVASTFLACSGKKEVGLCERVIASISRDNALDRLWIQLKEPYQDLDSFDTALGPESSIRITANKELLIDRSLKFIDMNWAELGFLGNNHSILYFPLSASEPDILDENDFSKETDKFMFQKVELGNENIRIRFYPSGNSFSAEVECKRSNDDTKKITAI